MKKLAIITTHPIQYYAPVFKLLHGRGIISIKVFYTIGEQNISKYDRGFGKIINWDIPLLEGYTYEFVRNTSNNPGSHHYKGIINPTLIRQITDWEPDAVLFFGWAYQGHLKAIRYFKGKIPVYFRGDSTLLNEQRGVKKVAKYFFLKWVYSHINHAFYVGTNNKAYFKKYGLKDNQLSFAPHAIDNDRFTINHIDEAKTLRLSLGIDDDKILILYAGKFEYVKNVDLLLNAYIKLNKPNVHLLLVGNGANEKLLKTAASSSPFATNIHFLEFKNQSYMPILYQAADLFCLPSLSETWGLAVNEAMACKKAILVSDMVGCAADLVKENFNGEIFENQNIDNLLIKLDRLTQSKTNLLTYGENSSTIIKDWSFLKIAEAIENKLNEAI